MHFLGSVIRLKVDLGGNTISLDTFNDQRTPPPPTAPRPPRHRQQRRPGPRQLSIARSIGNDRMNILFITADQWRGDCHRLRRPPAGQDAEPRCARRRGRRLPQPLLPGRPLLAGARLPLYRPLPDEQPRRAATARRSPTASTTSRWPPAAPATIRRCSATPTSRSTPRRRRRRSRPHHLRRRAARLHHAGEAARARAPWLSVGSRQQGLELPRPRRRPTCPSASNPAASPMPRRPTPPTRPRPPSSPTSSCAGSASRSRRPWFAHSRYLRPHPPFIVPAPYNTMYAPDEVGGFARADAADAEASGPSADGLLSLANATSRALRPRRHRPASPDLTDAEFRQIKATYYGMITEVDAQLGRVFDAITGARRVGRHADRLHLRPRRNARRPLCPRQGRLFRPVPAHPADHPRSRAGRAAARSPTSPRPSISSPPCSKRWTSSPRTSPTAARSSPSCRIGDARNAGATPCTGSSTSARSPARPPKRWFEARSTELNLAVIRTAKWKYVHFPALPPLLFDLERDPDNLVNLADDPAYAPHPPRDGRTPAPLARHPPRPDPGPQGTDAERRRDAAIAALDHRATWTKSVSPFLTDSQAREPAR